MNYWQVGSGTGNREYWQECLDFGMAFTGDEKMDEVDKDDLIVLRKGIHEIVAVGKVTRTYSESKNQGDKKWLEDFDGWELPYHCYVEWHKPEMHAKSRKQLAQYPICHVGKPELQNQAQEILATESVYESRGEPKPVQDISDEDILNSLARQGTNGEAAERFVQRLRQVRSLAKHYFDFGYPWKDVKEHEIRTFLIAPLLSALGWDERQLKIELNLGEVGGDDGRKSIDLACFSSDYLPVAKEENRKNCKLLIESKRFSAGLTTGAPKQVKDYAQLLTNCKTVVVTNGYCYKAFGRSNGTDEFSDTPIAYLNIRSPKRNYPLNPNVEGALEMLRILSPGTYD